MTLLRGYRLTAFGFHCEECEEDRGEEEDEGEDDHRDQPWRS